MTLLLEPFLKHVDFYSVALYQGDFKRTKTGDFCLWNSAISLPNNQHGAQLPTRNSTVEYSFTDFISDSLCETGFILLCLHFVEARPVKYTALPDPRKQEGKPAIMQLPTCQCRGSQDENSKWNAVS